MKKFFVWILMVSLLLVCAAAFAEAPVYPGADMAAPVYEWERDLYNHWQLDANGQPVNTAVHTLDDAMICTVCGSEVFDYGDGTGSGSVSNYDAHGNLLHYTGIEEGVAVNESRHILTYDENGVLVRDLEFIGGVLFSECIYAADAEGNAVPVTQTVWYDDGTSAMNEYDQNGNCVRSTSFESDGSLDVETLTEYAMSEDGWFYECKTLTRFASGATFYSEYNQYWFRKLAEGQTELNLGRFSLLNR